MTTFLGVAFLAIAFNVLSAEVGKLAPSDAQFIQQETAAGAVTVKVAALAAQKAVRPEVKALAEQIVKDHTTTQQELGALASAKGVELSRAMDPKDTEALIKLQNTDSKVFDIDFLTATISGHKQSIGHFEGAAVNAKDSELKAWAVQTLPTLYSHLSQAQELALKSPTVSTTTTTAPTESEGAVQNARDRHANTLTAMDQGNNQADINASAKIRQEVIADKTMSVNAQNVKIITNKGQVTLRGPVNTDAEKRIIGEIASRVAQVQNVTNLLEVKPTENN